MLPVHWSRYTSRLTTSDTLLAHCLLSENSQETVLPMAKALLRNARQLKYFHQSHLRDMFYTTINILMRWRFQPDVKALSVQDSPGLSPRSNRWPSTMPGGSSCHLPRSRTVPHPPTSGAAWPANRTRNPPRANLGLWNGTVGKAGCGSGRPADSESGGAACPKLVMRWQRTLLVISRILILAAGREREHGRLV
jgi:hypothetical protein